MTSRLMGIFVIVFFFFGAESESEEEESEEEDDDAEATGGVGRDVRARFLGCLPKWSLSEKRSDFEVPMVMLSVDKKQWKD